MNKSSLDKMINTALPYIVGGAVIYVIYKRLFSRNVDYIKKKIKTAEVKYLTMTELEKDEYASKQANLIGDILGTRLFSTFRNNDDIIEIVRGNKFCIVRIGKQWNETNKMRLLNLSTFLKFSLSHSDIVKIHDEVELLSDNGY